MTISNSVKTSTAIVVFVICFRMGLTEIIPAPMSKEVELGGSTYFNCSTSITSKEVQWFHYSVSSPERRFVYAFGQIYSPYLGRFKVEKNATAGEYNLLISSIQAVDAGKYECQDEAGAGMKRSAQLIILNTALVCQSNVNLQAVIGPNSCEIEPEQLILTCMVQYSGNEAPILRWELNDNDNQSIGSSVTHDIMTGNVVRYNLTLKPEQIANGSFYVCETNRSISTISCRTENIKIVGTTQVQKISNDYCNYKPYKNAIICLCVLLLLPLSIAVVALSLKLRSNRGPDLTEDNDALKNSPVALTNAATTDEEEPRPTERIASGEPLLSKESEDNDAFDKSPVAPTNAATTGKKEPTDATASAKPLQSKQSGGPDNGPSTEVKTLENKISSLKQKLKQSDDLNKEQINSLNALQLEKVQFQAKVKELEQYLYPSENIDYSDKPSLTYTIQLPEKSQEKIISGITILDKELFVVTENSQDIEVYDSKTFKSGQSWTVMELSNPMDIASSQVNHCLFIIDQGSRATESKVIRLNPKGPVLDSWSTGGGKGRLSTYESNVILCLSERQLINEYSKNGELLVTVRLSPGAKLCNPLHAIKVTSTCFVVSHGDVKDELHRVCIVDLEGNIIKECSKWEKSHARSHRKMNVPICLLEDKERSIIVADRDNNRILLLGSMLKYQRKLIESEKIISEGVPVRLCFDDTQSQLFVAVNKTKLSSNKKKQDDCRILIFGIK